MRPDYIRPTTTRHSSQEDLDAETERIWEEFWQPILDDARREAAAVGLDDQINANVSIAELNQIKKELADAQTAFYNLSILYSEVSGGMVSKPMTDPYVVIGLWHDQQQRDFGRDLVEWLEFARADRRSKEWKEALTRLIDLAKCEHGMETDDHGV